MDKTKKDNVFIIASIFCLVWDFSLFFIPMAILKFIFGVTHIGILLLVGTVFVIILGKYVDNVKKTEE